jgi:hypothetical protein
MLLHVLGDVIGVTVFEVEAAHVFEHGIWAAADVYSLASQGGSLEVAPQFFGFS